MRGPKLDWGLILLKPGQAMGEHGHREVEETFYVLEGTPTLIVDGRRIRTEPGDVFRLEPPERHDLCNEAEGTRAGDLHQDALSARRQNLMACNFSRRRLF